MKTKHILLILASIFTASCYNTKIKEEQNDGYCDPTNSIVYDGTFHDKTQKKVTYTNTSNSKYLEVTLKKENGVSAETAFIKLKPGQIEERCELKNTIITIVGEREISAEK